MTLATENIFRHVTDSIGQPIQAFVTLTVRDEKSAADFADADEKGFYRLEYDGEADSLIIRAADIIDSR